MELNRVKKGLPPSTLRTKNKPYVCINVIKCQNTYNIKILKKQIIMIERTLSHWKLVNFGLCPVLARPVKVSHMEVPVILGLGFRQTGQDPNA